MSATIPQLTHFKCFDATSVYSVEFISGTTTQEFTSFKSIIVNINNSNYETITGDIQPLNTDDYASVEDYIAKNKNEDNALQSSMMVYYNHNYYLILNKDCCSNGESYSLQTTFITEENIEYSTDIYGFKCFSDIVITLKDIVYQDGTQIEVDNSTQEITITQPVCTIYYAYAQDDGDFLKYCQFFLYDAEGQLLGSSIKNYSLDLSYTVENYNNLQKYILKLYCVSQNDNIKWHEIVINTNYNNESVYTDVAISFDKQNAQNIIAFNIMQLNGQGENVIYDHDINDNFNAVVLSDGAYVDFTDFYHRIGQNFLCKLWCKSLDINKKILTIKQTDGDGYIEIVFAGTAFCAYKYSCGLKTSYYNSIIKNEVQTDDGVQTTFVTDENDLLYKDIYFAVGHYNGRISMYAKLIESGVTE